VHEDSTYFFSIIIPTYNRADLITRTIKSILTQTFFNYEIIIVDDGSTDNSKEVIASFSNSSIKYFKTENCGVAHARNYGIQNASGKYIGFLDSDDLMEINHLQTAYDFINSNKNPEVVHLNFLWGLEDRSIVHKNILPKNLPLDIFKNCSLHVNCIFIQNIIAKNNLFNESRDLMFVEDWDFFIKLCVRYKIQLLDQCTSYLIDHEDRSMRNFDERKWVIKRDAIKISLGNDEVITKKYLSRVKTVTAHMNSLIAVNFASRKSKFKSLKYWFLSLNQNFLELFTKRSLAILKHLVFNW
jgi:glycosyltransferase involved in cell wall biosynthesis